ncbi:hypothetical protein [Streptomyces sp. NBC_01766]|uniref:hypothetical protein n=1 Tax=Streptomyces sp. NBC_01766 TaxID=2975936 RepID=UPI002DDC3CDB|nr:hypothetical protein [Streptomyces sp. NBC_01766]
MLVDLIGQDLHNPEALDAVGARYGQDLQDTFVEFYRGTLNVGELSVPEERLALLRAIPSNQNLVDRYFGTLSGVCSLDDFYNEELLDTLAQA